MDTKTIGSPALSLQEVTKVFGQGPSAVRAVDAVDLEVSQGEVLLIQGPSGGGKTTLLTMAGGLLRPTQGDISITGVKLNGLSDKQVSHLRLMTIGFIFQSFNLLAALTAQENVEVVVRLAGAGKKEARRTAAELLASLGLARRLNHRPVNLSGGEKQRVSIARALANNPALILADEPTANLDSARGREVMALLRGIAKEQGRTVLCVSHDHRIRDIADRVLWLEDGRLRQLQAVKDPVCGMSLDESLAPVRLVLDRETYYFCGVVCRAAFLERRNAHEPAGVPSSS
ncbi:MAG: ATP-binding cassette domain-containing protein [Chloroflexi bacterium]|nr:ATP-binding cassette domain-containing protein [Chloroflexota bacterium]